MIIDFAAARVRRDQLAVLAAAPAEMAKARNELALRRAGMNKKRREQLARASAVQQRAAMAL